MTKYLKGCDISHYQPRVDYGLMSRRLDFAYIKATNGTSQNVLFDTHWFGTEGKMRRGPYLYFLASLDPIAQADKLWEIVGDSNELRPALDLEYNSVDGANNNPAKFPDYGERVLACLYRMAEHWNDMPCLYSNPSFIKTYFYSPVFAEFPLWIASWGGSIPTIPPPFFPDWYMWQWQVTKYGRYYGLISDKEKQLDLDLLNPDWLDKIVPPEPPPPPQPGEEEWLVLSNGLRVRTGPSTSGTSTLGYVNGGDVVKEIELSQSGSDTWVKHNALGKEGWSAAFYSGKEYMRRV